MFLPGLHITCFPMSSVSLDDEHWQHLQVGGDNQILHPHASLAAALLMAAQPASFYMLNICCTCLQHGGWFNIYLRLLLLEHINFDWTSQNYIVITGVMKINCYVAKFMLRFLNVWVQLDTASLQIGKCFLVMFLLIWLCLSTVSQLKYKSLLSVIIWYLFIFHWELGTSHPFCRWVLTEMYYCEWATSVILIQIASSL